MLAELMDGRSYSKELNEETSKLAEKFAMEYKKKPGLAAILVGDDPASSVYVRSKEKACQKFGLFSEVIKLHENTTTGKLLKIIEKLNNDTNIHGILVQQPLPSQIDLQSVVEATDPDKDVDGFHPVNLGKLLIGQKCLIPCTPRGIIKLIKKYNVPLKGKNAVVIGRSVIVGKPVSLLLMQENVTVTMCHSKTDNLAKKASEADILVSAIGKPALIDENYVKKGATVIDVGINRISKEDAWESLFREGTRTAKDFQKKGYTLVGDVDFQKIKEIAGKITPVPGGVGPLTISMLLRNTVDAAYMQISK